MAESFIRGCDALHRARMQQRGAHEIGGSRFVHRAGARGGQPDNL
jgi:hypothetical protein